MTDRTFTSHIKEVAKSRLDQKRFKADMPELAELLIIKMKH